MVNNPSPLLDRSKRTELSDAEMVLNNNTASAFNTRFNEVKNCSASV